MSEVSSATAEKVATLAWYAAAATDFNERATTIEVLDGFLNDPSREGLTAGYSEDPNLKPRHHDPALEQVAIGILDARVIQAMNDNHALNTAPLDSEDYQKPRTQDALRGLAAAGIVRESFARVRRSAIGAPGF